MLVIHELPSLGFEHQLNCVSLQIESYSLGTCNGEGKHINLKWTPPPGLFAGLSARLSVGHKGPPIARILGKKEFLQNS